MQKRSWGLEDLDYCVLWFRPAHYFKVIFFFTLVTNFAKHWTLSGLVRFPTSTTDFLESPLVDCWVLWGFLPLNSHLVFLAPLALLVHYSCITVHFLSPSFCHFIGDCCSSNLAKVKSLPYSSNLHLRCVDEQVSTFWSLIWSSRY